MLSSGMVEGVGDAFEIRNASSSTLRHLRSFIYRGCLDDSQEERLGIVGIQAPVYLLSPEAHQQAK